MKKYRRRKHSINKRYYWLYKNGRLLDDHDIAGILFMQEYEIYELVDFLIRDVQRLRCFVMEAREKANKFATKKLKSVFLPYLMTAEDVYDYSFNDHPAMIRYFELYGGGDKIEI
jgi:hypothetical protein